MARRDWLGRIALPTALAGSLTGAVIAYAHGGADLVAGPVAAEVVRVVDGDTLDVRAHVWLGAYIEIAVRLDGVDAPELHGHCAQERDLAVAARGLVERLLGDGAAAQLHDIRPDKYGGRVRARVVTGAGTDLSQALLDAGLARPYRGGHRQPWCPDAG